MTKPSARLISHASVIMEVDGIRILTDPWLVGTAFNDSWKLITDAADLTPYLDSVDFLWISHEHPDHFHIPSLRSLPDTFKQRVTVLFQESSDHEKMVKALTGMLGFRDVRLLPHKQWLTIAPQVEVLCYQSRHLDSALALRGSQGTILNVNDCDLADSDITQLRACIGKVDLLLNQFSIAGFDGVEENLPNAAASVLNDVVAAHQGLEAKVMVPFASFAYFSAGDNRQINQYANTPMDLARRYEREGLALAVLLPGEIHRVGEPHDNGPALAEYERLYARLETIPSDPVPPVGFDALSTAFTKLRARMVTMHGSFGLRLLKPVVVEVPDLGLSVLMSFRDNSLKITNDEPAIVINSQPLHFMLSNSFGLQTLGVSGRLRLLADSGNWFRHRALMGMLNAGIGLAPRQVFSPRQLGFFWSRRSDLYQQTKHTVRRAMGGIAGHAGKPSSR